MKYIIDDWLLVKILSWSGMDLTEFLDFWKLEEYKEADE